MDAENLLKSFKSHGWYLTDEGLQKLRMAANTDDVHKLKEEAVNWDLKEIGGGALPTKMDHNNAYINGNIVLQIQKIRNIAAPKCNEQSSSSPRFLQCELTDGVICMQSLEMNRINDLNINLPPGTKLYFNCDRIQIMHGFILLKAEDIVVLGGWIESLVEKWEMARRMQKFSYNTRFSVGGLNNPPPWTPFGKHIDAQLVGELTNANYQKNKDNKTMTESTTSSASSKGNTEFNTMRNEAIAEASKVGRKKTFGGGQHNIMDHNLKKILAKGYTEEQAKNALKMTNNVLERALYNLKRQNGGNISATTATSSITHRNDRHRGGEGNGERSHGRRRGGRNTMSSNDQEDSRDQSKPATNISLFDFITTKLSTNTSNVTTTVHSNISNSTSVTSAASISIQQQFNKTNSSSNKNKAHTNNSSNANFVIKVHAKYNKVEEKPSSVSKTQLAQQRQPQIKGKKETSMMENKFENNMSVSFAATHSNQNQPVKISSSNSNTPLNDTVKAVTGTSTASNNTNNKNKNHKSNANPRSNSNEKSCPKNLESSHNNCKMEDLSKKDKHHEPNNNISTNNSSNNNVRRQQQSANNSSNRSMQRSSTRSFRVSYRRNNNDAIDLDKFNSNKTEEKMITNQQKNNANKKSSSTEFVKAKTEILNSKLQGNPLNAFNNIEEGANNVGVTSELTTTKGNNNYISTQKVTFTSTTLPITIAKETITTNSVAVGANNSNNSFTNYNLGKTKPTAFVSPLSKSLTPFDPNKILGFQTKEANEYAINILRSQGHSVAGYVNTTPTSIISTTSTVTPITSHVSTSTSTNQQVSVGSQTNATSLLTTMNMETASNQHHQQAISAITQTDSDLINEQHIIETANSDNVNIYDNEQNAIYEDEDIHHHHALRSTGYDSIIMPETNTNCRCIWRKGDICLARYWEDDKFYEAEVTDITEKTCVVFFMDYGNYEEVLKTDCMPIPNDICGQKMKLNIPYDLNDETPTNTTLIADMNDAMSAMSITSSGEGSRSSIEMSGGDGGDIIVTNQSINETDCSSQNPAEPFRRITRNHDTNNSNGNAVNSSRYRTERQVYVPPYKRGNRQTVKRTL